MQTQTLDLVTYMAAKKWLFPILSIAFASLFLFLSVIFCRTAFSALLPNLRVASTTKPTRLLPCSHNDAHRLLRLLPVYYHHRNRYLLHLSWDALASEHAYLANAACAEIPVIWAFGNVDVLGSGDTMTYMGSSVLAVTLHVMRILPYWCRSFPSAIDLQISNTKNTPHSTKISIRLQNRTGIQQN